MKIYHPSFVLTVILLLLWAACTTTQHTTPAGPERDGSSIENAVVVNSIREEYQWVQQHYPNSRVTGQALIKRKGKHYDELTFITPAGETKKAYFDINSFFGKF